MGFAKITELKPEQQLLSSFVLVELLESQAPKDPRESSSVFLWLWVDRPLAMVMYSVGLFLSHTSPGRDISRLLFVTQSDTYQLIHQEFILKAKLTSFWTDLKPNFGCFLLGDREL